MTPHVTKMTSPFRQYWITQQYQTLTVSERNGRKRPELHGNSNVCFQPPYPHRPHKFRFVNNFMCLCGIRSQSHRENYPTRGNARNYYGFGTNVK